jgi:hypothetical protein
MTVVYDTTANAAAAQNSLAAGTSAAALNTATTTAGNYPAAGLNPIVARVASTAFTADTAAAFNPKAAEEADAKSWAFAATTSAKSAAGVNVHGAQALTFSSDKPPQTAAGTAAKVRKFQPNPNLNLSLHMALGNYAGFQLSVHTRLSPDYTLFFQKFTAGTKAVHNPPFLVSSCISKDFCRVEAERKGLSDYISICVRKLAGITELISRPNFDSITLETKLELRKRQIFIKAALEEQAKQKEEADGELEDSPFSAITPRRGAMELQSIG